MNKQISIPIKNTDFKEVSRLIISLCRLSTPEEKIFAYMITHSQNGYYHCLKGSRLLCVERLHITKKQYETAVKALVDLKVITKRQNSDGSQYIYYELHPVAKKVRTSKNDFQIILKFT